MPVPDLALSIAIVAAAVPPGEADPAAAKAFAEFLAAHRALPSVQVECTAVAAAMEAGEEARGQPVRMKLVHGRPGGDAGAARRGVLDLRGFTCWLGDGTLAAIHESSADAYWTTPDDGSPFYALMTVFVDLPFPDLTFAFGEEDPEEAVMQLHPRAPDVLPRAVRDEEIDGRPVRTIEFAAEHQTIRLVLERDRPLPIRMTTTITGGPLAGPGGIRYEHAFDYTLPEAPLGAEAFAFDPGLRQRVDLFPALVKREAPRVGPDGQRVHALVGKEVPGLALPLLDGGVLEIPRQRGKVLVLDFWATWCGPCRAAMPALHEVAAMFRGEGMPVSVFTVNVSERERDPEARRALLRKFWSEAGHTLPVAIDLEGEAFRGFEVPALPTTVIVRADGVVHAVHVGFHRDRLVNDVRAALEAAEPAPIE